MPTVADSATRVAVDRDLVESFRADYADAFRINAARGTAGEWATLSLQGVDAGGGAFRRVIWGGVLGFDLAEPGAPGTKYGWTIERDDPESLELGVDGRLMEGRMVFRLDGGALRWSTLLRYHHAAARPVWVALSPVHRAAVPRCLNGAAAVLVGAARGGA